MWFQYLDVWKKFKQPAEIDKSVPTKLYNFISFSVAKKPFVVNFKNGGTMWSKKQNNGF